MNETLIGATDEGPRDYVGGHVDWAAILAGAAIAAGASIVFTGFTAALGLGSVSAEQGEGLGWFALVLIGAFAFIAMVAVYGLGGYVAGRMRRRTSPSTPTSEDEVEARDGIHGLTVWSIGIILSGILAAGAVSDGVRAAGNAAGTVVEAGGAAIGGAVQGAGQLAGGVVGGAGQLAGGAIGSVGDLAGGAMSGASDMGGNPLDYVSDRFFRGEAAAPDQFSDDAIRREFVGIMGTLLRTGEIPEDDLDYLRDALAARTELTPAQIDARVESAVTQVEELRAEAEARIEDARTRAEEALAQAEAQAAEVQAAAEQQLQEARDTAIEAAETARRAAVWSALFLAVSALIAGVAAWLGAIKGGQDRDAGRVWGALARRRI